MTESSHASEDQSETKLPLAGKVIVCLATQEWDAHWSVAQQVASRLAPDNRVIYVEPFHPPFAWLKQKNQLLKKQRKEETPRIRTVQPNLVVYRPEGSYLPGNMRSQSAYRWNSFVYAWELRRMMRNLDAQHAIIWAFFSQSLVVTTLPCDAFVYDCVDDWPSFFPNPIERKWVERMDAGLTKRADIVFTGSGPLRDKKAGQNRRIQVVNHAADVAHFLKASAAETVEPPDIANLPHPRIGFVGMIDTLRFDQELIVQLARINGYQVVIVGGFLNGAERLIPDFPNIHKLGMRQVSELPGYLKGMDVCIMPYRVNETTRYIFPLKLFEYLATGKPVVATAIPAVEQHSHYIYVAYKNEQFIDLVRDALASDTAVASERRQQHARSHDWLAHVGEKAKALADIYDERVRAANN